MRDDLYSEIRKVAYELHEKRGWKQGHDLEDWLEAEKIVLARYERSPEKKQVKKSAKVPTKKGK